MMPVEPRRLLLRLRPWTDESWSSYLTRLSVHNYPSSPHLVATLYQEWLQLQQSQDQLVLPRERASFEWLGYLCWLTPAELYALTGHIFADTLTPVEQVPPTMLIESEVYPLLSGPTPLHWLSDSRARYCPACLREQGYHRRHWSLRSVTLCLQHHCLLRDHCPYCEQKVDVAAVCAGICPRCRLALTTADTPDMSLDKEGLSAQQHLLDWLTKTHPLSPDLSNLSLSPQACFQVLHDFLNVLKSQPLRLPRGKQVVYKPTDPGWTLWQWHRRLTHAFHMMTEWPTHFYHVLANSEQAATNPRGQRNSLTAVTRQVSDYVQHRWTHPVFEPMQSAFEQYFLRTYARLFHVRQSTYYRQRPYLSHKMRYLTYVEAAAILQLQPRALTILATTGEVDRVRSQDSAHFLFNQESIRSLHQRWSAELTLVDIAVQLELDEAEIQSLAVQGFLVAAPPFQMTHAVNERFPYVFLKWLFDQIQRGYPSHAELLTLQEAVTALGSMTAVLQPVLEGRLTGYVIGKPVISNIQFRATHITGLQRKP